MYLLPGGGGQLDLLFTPPIEVYMFKCTSTLLWEYRPGIYNEHSLHSTHTNFLALKHSSAKPHLLQQFSTVIKR